MFKIPIYQYRYYHYFFVFILLYSVANMSSAASLSSTYLSPGVRSLYAEYLNDVKAQQDTYEDLMIEQRHAMLYKQFTAAVQRMRYLAEEQGWPEITLGLKTEDKPAFSWGDTYHAMDSEHDWVVPIIHHKGDLRLNNSIKLDMPLLVEGDLHIEGSLVMTDEDVPLIVLGSLNARHLFYRLDMSHYGPHLFVRDGVRLDGYAFLGGETETFDQGLKAKGVFDFYPIPIFRNRLSENNPADVSADVLANLLPFPGSPAEVRPGILNTDVRLDEEVLEKYLLLDIDPFTFQIPRSEVDKPWSDLLNQWMAICYDSFRYPELSGGRTLVHLPPQAFSIEVQKEFEKEKITSISVMLDLRVGNGFYTYEGEFFNDTRPFRQISESYTGSRNPVERHSDYPSTFSLAERYKDTFAALFYGEVNGYDNLSFSDVWKTNTSDRLYERERALLSDNPYLSLYWLLHFGLVFDDRFDEVLEIVKHQKNPTLDAAILFFQNRAYEYDTSSYVDYDFGRLEQLFLPDGGLVFHTGNEVFRSYHSDYIYAYYLNHHHRNSGAVGALSYAISNDYSGLSLEKAIMLIEAARSSGSWDLIEIPAKPLRNEFAWNYIHLFNPLLSTNDEAKVGWMKILLNKKSIAAETRISALRLIESSFNHSGLINSYIEAIKNEL